LTFWLGNVSEQRNESAAAAVILVEKAWNPARRWPPI
jgi:hypothetical protein